MCGFVVSDGLVRAVEKTPVVVTAGLNTTCRETDTVKSRELTFG